MTNARSSTALVTPLVALMLLASLGMHAHAQSESPDGAASAATSSATGTPTAEAETRAEEEAALAAATQKAAEQKAPKPSSAPKSSAEPKPNADAKPGAEAQPNGQSKPNGEPSPEAESESETDAPNEEPPQETAGPKKAPAAPKPAPKPATPQPTESEKPSVAQLLLEKAAHIDELLAGKLSVDIDPKSLFSVDVADTDAAAIEARWLGTIISEQSRLAGLPPPEPAVTEEAKDAKDGGSTDATAQTAPTANESGDGAEAKPPSAQKIEREYEDLRTSDPALFKARLALDRARLRFYSLPSETRKQLLDRHRERQRNLDKEDPEQQLNDAQQREKLAQREREKALEAARTARSEAERLIAEERARLLSVAERQAQYDARLVEHEQALKKEADERLALRRLVGEVLVEATLPVPNMTRVDGTYDRVIRKLDTTRDALSRSLAKLNARKSAVPVPGRNPLEGLPDEMDLTAVDETRRDVTLSAERLKAKEDTVFSETAHTHYTDMEALDDLRLHLVPHLSDQKRSTVTGLGPGGLEQAFSEARHVILVLRYHHSVTTRWLAAITRPSATRGKSALTATLIAIKWILPIGVFIWWRRRAERALKKLEEKIREENRAQRGPGQTHPLLHLLELIHRVRRPLEWLLLVWAIAWLLPPEAQNLLEVELTRTIFTWTLGGMIAVTATDFLADLDGPRHRRKSVMLTAHLRLRSLRLVGRAVVVFGLILALTDQIVGKGTIYSWVFNIVWFAAIIIFFILVKWWRTVIFQRVATKRKKTRFDTWISDNQTGWKSFVAAVSGGIALFVAGGYRAVRARVSSFSLTRQLLAYLFQRDMTRQAEEVKEDNCKPLDRARYRLLSPMKHSDVLIPSVADGQLDQIIDRINLPGGGVFAIVGERGSGKTTLIKRIAERAEDIIRVPTPFGDMTAFEPALLKALKKSGSLEEAVRSFDEGERDAGILIDNAHRLIQPRVGGFEGFDRVLAMARTCSKNISWVFAFDEVIWRLLQRMRGTKPLFDDVIRIAPWKEEGIVSLLTSRNEKAGIEPSFEALMGELPEDADEIDYEEALASTEENYLRLLWHYSSGNPGLAMHAWRMSLGLDETGEVRVRVFQAPSPALLEGLPDNAHFVLRAIVQLERARLSQICEVTRLPLAAVQDVVRYGRVKGYIDETEDGIGITWTWFRAVTKLLQRRHLLYPAQD